MNQSYYIAITSRQKIRYTAITTLSVTVLLAAIAIINCTPAGDHPSLPPAMTTSGIPPIPDALKQRMERYQIRRFASLVDWAADGNGLFVLGRSEETSQLFRVTKSGNPPQQLTSTNESIIHAWACPDPGRNLCLFTHDSGGNENFQINALDLASLRTSRLTRDSAQNDGVVWSNRGDQFVFSSNRRNGKDFDLYLSTIDTPGTRRSILLKGGVWAALDWSPDDQQLLIGNYISLTSSRLYCYDLDSMRLTAISETSDTVSQELGAWGPDGRGIFYTSDVGTDVRCLHYIEWPNRRDTLLTATIPWDVREITLSRDRQLLAFTTNEHGFSQVYIMDAGTFAFRKVPSLPRGIIGTCRFHPAGGFCAVTITTPQHPEDVYVLDLKDFTTLRWTNHNPAGSTADVPASPDIVEYLTFDSVGGKPRRIPCLIYKPINRTPPFPVLITIHGGPETQFWPSYRPEVNFYLEELGIAVIAPNVRGSGGYGKNYLMLDDGMRRKDAVGDIGALLDWIVQQPDLDSSRIAVSGGSYGGYMALASMVRYGNRLRAGIDCYGIGNFITFLENTAPYRRDLRRVEYGDERDPVMRKFLIDISPLAHTDRITKPLLIVQGANDPRVPLSESRRIVDALRKKGTPVWFLVAGNEGHGFRRKSNKDYQEWVTALFLKEFVAGE